MEKSSYVMMSIMKVISSRRRKAISRAAVVLIVIVILAVAGIGVYYISTLSKPSTPPKTLTIMSISGFTDSFYTQVAKDFMAQNPGVNITVLSAPFSGILSQEQTLLQAHSSQVDIVTGTPSMIGTLAAWTVDLRPYISQYGLNMSDIIPAMQSSNGNIALPNGTVLVKALAVMSDAMMIY
ncbi:MAG: hypothetical protein QXX17_05400, partial [Conexivisphaerales archaeon]